MFLVFEGIDGAGKSTQIRLLANYMKREKGLEVLVLQESGGTTLGKSVRKLLLKPTGGELTATTEVFLFMGARSHLVSTRIRPALEAGKVVICDRFLWSSVVYQGIVGGLGEKAVLDMGRIATKKVMPNQTYILDLPVSTVMCRKSFSHGGDRIENKGRSFQEKVRKGFLKLARQYPGKMTIIDARGSAETVHERIVAKLPRLPKR